MAGAGDVNGDGYDDILIGASSNDEGGTDSGKVYLIFGPATDWTQGMDLASVANASFLGENNLSQNNLNKYLTFKFKNQ